MEANDQFRTMLGYVEHDVAKLALKDILIHEDRAIRTNIQEMLERGQGVFGIRQYKRVDGSVGAPCRAHIKKRGRKEIYQPRRPGNGY